MLDKLITYIVCWYKTLYQCLLRELTASQLVAIATHSDTGSHNRLDLIQSLVPPHYVCNGYVSCNVFLNTPIPCYIFIKQRSLFVLRGGGGGSTYNFMFNVIGRRLNNCQF